MENNSDIAPESAVQGRVTGVIVPPPEIRAIVEKTAAYVAKHGKSFEQKIASSADGKSAKFNFLRSYDPYNAYYEMKIREFEEGKVDQSASEKAKPAPAVKVEEKPAAPTPAAPTTTMKASFINPLAKYSMNKPTEAPKNFEFFTGHPTSISALEFDTIKLTAQYTAVNGRDFLSNIVQKEQRNPQFDFLKPTHMLFGYFTSLVDAYTKILEKSDERLQAIEEGMDRMKVLEKSVNRWSWNKIEQERKKREEQAAESDKVFAQSIDWSDFVVVETIDFPIDEVLEVPLYANLHKNDNVSKPAPIAAPRIGTVGRAVGKADDSDVDMDMDMEDDSDIKVVTDYVPRTAQTTAKSSSSSTSMLMVDPLSGKQVPADQMEEHMRVQLLHPKWREEQKRFLDKQKETGFAEDASIAENLRLFAKKRSDIFGSEASAGPEQHEEVVPPTPPTVQWDGHQASRASAIAMKQDLSRMAPPATSAMPPPVNMVGPAPIIPNPPQTHHYGGYAPPPMQAPPAPSLPLAPSLSSMHGGQYMPPFMNPMAPPGVPTAVPPPPPPQQSHMGYPTAPAPYFPPPLPTAVPVPSAHSEDHDTKRQAVEKELIPADEFARLYSGPITIQILVPVDTTPQGASWNMNGQSLNISIDVNSTTKDLKDLISNHLGGMPGSKQQLKAPSGVFLKDASSLAAMNIYDGSSLELSTRQRGGGKR